MDAEFNRDHPDAAKIDPAQLEEIREINEIAGTLSEESEVGL